MVKLEDTIGKSLDDVANGAYARCFGNIELSLLLSRVQSLIIKNGYELEKIITDLVSDLLIDDLDDFLAIQIIPLGVRVVEKKVIKRSNIIEGHGIEPDFIIFERIDKKQNCYVLELKDGHEFDTKSSSKEHTNLHTFLTKNAMALKDYRTYCKICGFNAGTKEDIRIGFKNKIALTQAMTGRELCKLLNLDYDAILKSRANDREDNYQQFLNDLVSIVSIRKDLINKIG